MIVDSVARPLRFGLADEECKLGMNSWQRLQMMLQFGQTLHKAAIEHNVAVSVVLARDASLVSRLVTCLSPVQHLPCHPGLCIQPQVLEPHALKCVRVWHVLYVPRSRVVLMTTLPARTSSSASLPKSSSLDSGIF